MSDDVLQAVLIEPTGAEAVSEGGGALNDLLLWEVVEFVWFDQVGRLYVGGGAESVAGVALALVFDRTYLS